MVNKTRRPNFSINFSGVRGTSDYGHQIHAAVAAAYSWTDKYNAFGDYAASNSNHGHGRALDIHVPVQPKTSSNKAWDVAQFLKTNAKTLRVTQVIFQQKIWTTQRSGEGWRPMSDRGNDTANHYDHIHVSFGPGSGDGPPPTLSVNLPLSTSGNYWSGSPVGTTPELPSGPDIEGGGGGSADIADTSTENKEFRYNPPIHPANLHVRVDLNTRTSLDDVYDEGGAPRNYTDKWAGKNLNDLRLGRIIQHTVVPGHASQMKHRWGFRFLYNPTSLTYAASRNNSFVIDGRSEANMAMSGINQNFQFISLVLLLDRVPDVLSPELQSSDYTPALRNGDKVGIRKFGTHWDLEALFKVCNGEWNLTDRGKSSNIGVLIPSNSRLILGKGDNLYGFVQNVVYTDLLFSQDMIPIRTEVTIQFKRHLDMTPDQITEAFPGMGSVNSGEDVGSAGGGDDGLPGPADDLPSGGNNQDAPAPGYNKVRLGFYGYEDHNGWDYPTPSGTPVFSTTSGTVRDIVPYLSDSYGTHVKIVSGNVLIIYAHLSSISTSLREGKTVRAGQFLGKSGDTGNSTGPHLHYEERLNGKPRIPIYAKNTGSIR